jgi:hypothetical protein
VQIRIFQKSQELIQLLTGELANPSDLHTIVATDKAKHICKSELMGQLAQVSLTSYVRMLGTTSTMMANSFLSDGNDWSANTAQIWNPENQSIT